MSWSLPNMVILPADGRLFQTQPDVTELIVAEMGEALRQGIDGILQEHPLYKRPWGFDLAQIKPPVHIWHGLVDAQAAPAWSVYLAEHIPDVFQKKAGNGLLSVPLVGASNFRVHFPASFLPAGYGRRIKIRNNNIVTHMLRTV